MGRARQRTNGCLRNYDWMAVLAVMPLPLGLGPFSAYPFDGTYQLLPGTLYGHTINQYTINQQIDPALSGKTFYLTATVVDTYVGGTVTTVYQNHLYYRNPILPENPGEAPASYNPTIAADIRCCGFPTDQETVITISGAPPPQETLPDYYAFDQSFCPAPTIAGNGLTATMYWPANYPTLIAPAGLKPYYPISTTITFSTPVTWSQYLAAIQELLDYVPLIPSTVGTREGPVWFDFYGLSSVAAGAPQRDLSGYSYNASGVATIPITPNRLYSIQMGANENYTGGFNSCWQASGPFSAVNNQLVIIENTGFPVQWKDGTTPTGITDYVASPPATTLTQTCPYIEFDGGYNTQNNAPGATADSQQFISELSTLTLYNGKPSSPVTAILATGKCNQLLVFPTKGHAARNPPVVTMLNGWGYASGGSNFSFTYPVYPAINCPAAAVASFPGGIMYGYAMAATRIKIPLKFASVTSDPTLFQTLQYAGTAGIFPNCNNMDAERFRNFSDQTTLTYFEHGPLTTGEYSFGPEDVGGSLNNGDSYGWLVIYTKSAVQQANPVTAGQPDVTAAGGGTNQAIGGGQDSGV